MPREIEAIIEIPMGSQNKYEVCKERGLIKLDRVLFAPMTYPAEYGFIENTLAYDGDPLDVLVLVTNPTFPGCVIDVRVLGYLEMYDEEERDEKLIAVPKNDPRFSHVKTLNEIPPHTLLEIEYFFSTYKDLQGQTTRVGGWKDHEEAKILIEECFGRYSSKKIKEYIDKKVKK